jgi:phage major head subunit gpT-like protein
MPVLNTDNARAAARNFRAIFYNELRKTGDEWWRDLFMIFPSESPEENFNFMRGNPSMREWIGDRIIKSVSQASFTLVPKEWEATISVLRSQIIYDKLSQVRLYIQQLGQSFPEHYRDLAVALLTGGFAATGYDGQYYFDTDHDNGVGGAYSNKATAAFSSGEWATARKRPVTLREKDGRHLGIRYTHLYYGVDAEAAVESVFNLQFVSDGETAATTISNKYFMNLPPDRRRVIPELGASAKWFLFDLSKPIKPFVLMIVKGVDFVALDAPTDWNVFSKKEFVYGIDSIDNAGYALWELAYGSTAGE